MYLSHLAWQYDLNSHCIRFITLQRQRRPWRLYTVFGSTDLALIECQRKHVQFQEFENTVNWKQYIHPYCYSFCSNESFLLTQNFIRSYVYPIKYIFQIQNDICNFQIYIFLALSEYILRGLLYMIFVNHRNLRGLRISGLSGFYTHTPVLCQLTRARGYSRIYFIQQNIDNRGFWKWLFGTKLRNFPVAASNWLSLPKIIYPFSVKQGLFRNESPFFFV